MKDRLRYIGNELTLTTPVFGIGGLIVDGLIQEFQQDFSVINLALGVAISLGIGVFIGVAHGLERYYQDKKGFSRRDHHTHIH